MCIYVENVLIFPFYEYTIIIFTARIQHIYIYIYIYIRNKQQGVPKSKQCLANAKNLLLNKIWYIMNTNQTSIALNFTMK